MALRRDVLKRDRAAFVRINSALLDQQSDLKQIRADTEIITDGTLAAELSAIGDTITGIDSRVYSLENPEP